MTGQRRRRGCASLLALALLVAGGALAHAAQTFEVAVGLGDRVVSDRRAPIRLTFPAPPADAARLRVLQDTGNAWRGEATMSLEIPLVLSDAGDCEEVLPLYDAVLPLRMELLSASGEVLFRQEVDLRSKREDAPFPVGVGTFALPLADGSVLVSPAELPRDWSGLDAAESVWIGRTRDGLDADRWDTLARWVLSGGTHVVFTGGDFLLLDAPRLRDLLPIAVPTLTKRRDGADALAGDLRGGATVLLWKESVPWLVARRYGGGNVLLVATDAFRLNRGELAEIQEHVSPASTLSLVEATTELLDRQPMDRPGGWVAVLLVTGVHTALAALTARHAGRRSTAPALIGVFGLLTLASWLYVSSAPAESSLYQTNVRLSLCGSLGVSVSCSGLFSAVHQPEEADVKLDGAPSEILPRTLEAGSYDLAYNEGTARVDLAAGERRFLTMQGTAPLRLEARLSGDEEAELTSSASRRIPSALVLIDGEGFPLPGLAPRANTVYLGDPLPENTYHLGTDGGPLDRLLSAVARMLPLDQGAWLVAGEVTETRRALHGSQTRVRDVDLYVVEVARD